MCKEGELFYYWDRGLVRTNRARVLLMWKRNNRESVLLMGERNIRMLWKRRKGLSYLLWERGK